MIKKEIVDGFCCCLHNMAFAISFCTIFAPPVCDKVVPLHFSVTPSIQSGRAKFLFLFWKGGRWNLYFSLNGQNRPKIGFCRVFVMAFVESNLKNERFHDSLFSLKTLYLGKFWFISYRPKCYCPIRFTKEPITYVWRVFWDSI